ncbi:MAG: hypothetical protein JXR27_12935 [Paludibacteraceae bacterium]|nr:hypothetical protein [Paludibacteraceae bacterium]
MKKHFQSGKCAVFGMWVFVLIIASMFNACDKYPYDNEVPDWLGASIYEYLKQNANFTNYSRMIEDLGYVEVLSTTGSKTIFVADDEAF